MKIKVWVGVLSIALLVTGCGSSKNSTANPTTTTVAATVYPVSVHTSSGDVTVASRPTHIVSLSPTATEMLFAVDAGAQVKAVDSDSDYPTNAPKTSLTAYTPNVEAIAAEQPDLVIVSNDTNNLVDSLHKLNITTLVLSAANTLDDTYAQITAIGQATDHAKEANTLVSSMKSDMTSLEQQVPKSEQGKTYYHELDQTYYSITSSTFAGSLYKLAGLTNIADATTASGNNYPQLSAEKVVSANPNFIFLADTKCCGQNQQVVAQRPGWSGLSAVKSGDVVLLDDDVASRWGPRVVDFFRAIVNAEKADANGTAVAGSSATTSTTATK